ncbi:hypothetical protein [Paraburkholderia sp. DHOC27]|uniref:hypothetical protein n=1 Tax=Paraburkholderia sp. DHOC27 TaxID=2303330 RepID=UPI000E3C88E6|nr:hypothetical protein [Paraburkholderia sp. DHOC27]RFU44445.1 hypothetical protein D0B32_27950 [Paraburkholderia sp. DHOC27]
MNPVIERDVVHVGRIMRASMVSCTSEFMLADYWRGRLSYLMAAGDLTECQLHALQGLAHELVEIEKQLGEMHTRNAGGVQLKRDVDVTDATGRPTVAAFAGF